MKILGNADRSCKPGHAEWFSGQVWMDFVAELSPPSRLQAVLVSFAPGARTAWHTHLVGQTLFIVSGIGWVQLRGQAARVIRSGDVVRIDPGEDHWHGAEKDHTMVHLAMQENDATEKNVIWAAMVTDAEYGAL